MDELSELMVKHGAVIRAIQHETVRRYVVNKNSEPLGTVIYDDSIGRNVDVSIRENKHAGQFLLELTRDTYATVKFSGKRYFNSIQEIVEYLKGLGK